MEVQDHAARRSGDEVVSCLGRALAVCDPPPEELREVASELFTWRTVDAELAELLRAPAPAD
jgi:hypothetical protein